MSLIFRACGNTALFRLSCQSDLAHFEGISVGGGMPAAYNYKSSAQRPNQEYIKDVIAAAVLLRYVMSSV